MQVITLDLTGVPCPINFVRTKLKLEELAIGDQLQVTLDDGEPIESVTKSMTEEGQRIMSKVQHEERWLLVVQKII